MVHALLEELAGTRTTPDVLLITADDITADVWQRHLGITTSEPCKWKVATKAEVVARRQRLPEGYLVVADELEMYATEDFAAVVGSTRGFLGLCASSSGKANLGQLRKHFGGKMQPSTSGGALDLSALADIAYTHNDADVLEPTEQLLTIGNPEDSLNFYLTQTKQYPLLMAEEEGILARQIEAGVLAKAFIDGHTTEVWPSMSTWRQQPWWQRTRPTDDELLELVAQGQAAFERFLTGNLRLVYSIARRYAPRMDLMDAIQEGNLGLIRAVQKFDWQKGYKFSTYATWWIRQAITRAIADQTLTIRLPAHVHESDAPILSEWRKRQRESEDTSPEAIAKALAMRTPEVANALSRHRAPLSIEALVEMGLDILDPVADVAHDHAASGLLRAQIASVLDTLAEREAGIIIMRYGLDDGEDKTLDQIGKVYGVTRERIRQIEQSTLEVLRHPARANALIEYL